MVGLAVTLAIAAAAGYAVAAWLQQSAVHTATCGGALDLSGWTRVLRARRWMTGFGLVAVAATLHAAALSLAPIVVVQPIGVLAIALTTVLAARSAGTRLTRATGLAVAASMLGVGLFVVLAALSPTSTVLPDGVEVRAIWLVGLLVAAVGAIGVLTGGRLRCLAFAAAAGLSYGLVSVLVHTIAVRAETRGLTHLHIVPFLGIAGALLVGGFFVQHAYAAGPPQVVVACQTVLDPMLAVGVGIGLLGEAGQLGFPAMAGLSAGAVLAVTGVLVLARQRPPSPKSIVERPVPESLCVVIGADTFPPDINGAANFADRLARGLAGRGHDVHVLCPATEAGAKTERHAGVTIHRIASRRTPFHPTFRACPPWQARRTAEAVLDDLAPDVVHVQAHFLVGRALVRAAAKRGIPLLATNHFMPENLYGHGHIPGWLRELAARLGWWDLRRVFGAARLVTAPTPRAVRLLAENGLPGALPVSCGIDLARFGRSGTAEGRRVLFVGRLDEEKRVDELLRAAALLDLPGVEVEIVGDGSCRAAWEELAARLGISVRFRGFVSEDDLVEAYARASVFCMPGVAELQSLATMEAMAAGKPVVAADAMALPHLVRPGRNGWLYPPGDVPALAEALRAVLADPQATARMGAASAELIAEHTLDRTLETFEGLYRRALGAVPALPAVAAA